MKIFYKKIIFLGGNKIKMLGGVRFEKRNMDGMGNLRQGKLWRMMKRQRSVVCRKLWKRLWSEATVRLEVDYGQ
ncbi:MAG: hypothetical protein K2I10_14765 [Lachnospiraceae bacterium]|nr:hypothetical protein [Lachnospiraceae bacterium]